MLAAFAAVRTVVAVGAVLFLAVGASPETRSPLQFASIVERAPALMEAALATIDPKDTAADPLSDSDRALLADAHAEADRNHWKQSRDLAERSTHEIGRLTIAWRYLLDESSGPTFSQVSDFLQNHPHWPREEALIRRAETLLPRTYTPEQVIAWFGSREPLGKDGMVRLGQALIDTGKEAEGRKLIADAWIGSRFSEAGELNFLELYAPFLNLEEHAARFERLLAADALTDAKRQAARLSGTERQLAQARLDLRRNGAKALPARASLPAVVRDDPRYRFDFARALRRADREEDAWQVMVQLTPETLVDPVMSWRERDTLVRDALRAQKPQIAYALASQHSLSADRPEFAEAEFLSGWIALTRLKEDESALRHFGRMSGAVKTSISQARALYWIGRAQEALGHDGLAREAYAAAGKHQGTFYGQLALTRVGPEAALLQLASAPAEADQVPAALRQDERLQALYALETLEQWKLVQTFATHLAQEYEDRGSLKLLTDIVARSGNRKNALKVAKIAAQKNVVLLGHSAPLLDVPKSAVELGVEKALVLGLSRQESEFDPNAKSPVGASGLMQLMPATAKEVARSLGIVVTAAKLTDPATNLLLGSAYLDTLLKRWSGSYLLSIASYNAGPGNVSKWLRLNGDPRTGDVDPVDWIESIPFAETRNYVQRVLENTQLYRSRLGGDEEKLTIGGDLERGSHSSVGHISTIVSQD